MKLIAFFQEKISQQKIVKIILMAGIFCLFLITRLWQLSDLPWGIHVDEAGMAYDAWCLSQYGVDRYLKSWPVYLTNFGGGQSSLYAFLCAFLFKFFGYSLWIARIPAVLFSLLNLIFGIKLIRKFYSENTYLSIAAGGLLTICPYFIMAGRFALDCNLMLGMSTVYLYYFFTAVETRQLRYYFIAGLAGGMVLYTYALTYIVLPLFLFFSFLYLLRTRKFLLRGWAVMAVPMGILAMPLILVQVVNFFDLEEFQLGYFTITKLQVYRASEIEHFRISYLYQALHSIFTGDALTYNSIPAYSNLYGVTNIFFMLGLVTGLWRLGTSIKKKSFDFIAIPLLWFFSVFILEIHINSNVNKINGIFCSVIMLTIAGIDFLNRVCQKIVTYRTGKKGFRIIPVVLICCYTLYFTNFSIYYFGGTYTADTYLLPYFGIPFSEAVEFIEQDSILCEKETQVAEPEIIYAICKLESPYILKIWEKQEEGESFGKYLFNRLGEISDQCNYIVRDGFDEYCVELRSSGFTEERFAGYSLFYKK